MEGEEEEEEKQEEEEEKEEEEEEEKVEKPLATHYIRGQNSSGVNNVVSRLFVLHLSININLN